jgi:hypothetical protein
MLAVLLHIDTQYCIIANHISLLQAIEARVPIHHGWLKIRKGKSTLLMQEKFCVLAEVPQKVERTKNVSNAYYLSAYDFCVYVNKGFI